MTRAFRLHLWVREPQRPFVHSRIMASEAKCASQRLARQAVRKYPPWGHPLCGDKASFRSLFARNYSCQPTMGMSFRVEDLRCDPQLHSRRWWSSHWAQPLVGRGLQTPTRAPSALGLEHRVLERAVMNNGAYGRSVHVPDCRSCAGPQKLGAYGIPVIFCILQQKPVVASGHLWSVCSIPNTRLPKPRWNSARYWWWSKINRKDNRKSRRSQDKNRNKRRFRPYSLCTWLRNKAGGQKLPDCTYRVSLCWEGMSWGAGWSLTFGKWMNCACQVLENNIWHDVAGMRWACRLRYYFLFF